MMDFALLKEEIYPAVHMASSISQVNSNKATVSTLNLTEVAIEITNLKACATQWSDTVSVHWVGSSVSDSEENILERKHELGNS